MNSVLLHCVATSKGWALGVCTMRTLVCHKELHCLAQTASEEAMQPKAEAKRDAVLQGHIMSASRP